MNIAIVGAGVSGLRTASLLAQAGHSVTIFDSASDVGGAATTMPVDLGTETRWVDMGVNDFNYNSYTRLVALLDELGVPYADLSDTAAFYKADGSVSFTIDPNANTMPPGMAAEYARFKAEAKEAMTDPKYASYSVERYLTERKYSKEFAAWNIFPRVNGMYFCHDTTPATMPIRGVMHYYHLQEGFGASQAPLRKYFVDGAGSWIRALTASVVSAGVDIRLNTSVQVGAGEDYVAFLLKDGKIEKFDACVMACHATTALRTLFSGVTQATVNVLRQFSYADSVSVAHTYSPVLPPNKNDWRTYNILIHEQFEQLRPYTITYVSNMHQNDMANPKYNRFDTPYFFLSLNPPVPIPERCVLKTPGPNPKPVIARFPHNILNLATMAAQAQVPNIQGVNNLYFCGGWTVGAGLQEECLMSAEIVANLIDGNHSLQGHYDESPDAKHYAPSHIRESLNL